jgi:hypothetical protein
MYVPCIMYNLLFRQTNAQYINSNVFFVQYPDMFWCVYIFTYSSGIPFITAKVTKSIQLTLLLLMWRIGWAPNVSSFLPCYYATYSSAYTPLFLLFLLIIFILFLILYLYYLTDLFSGVGSRSGLKKKLPLFTPWRAVGGVTVYLHLFLLSALDRGQPSIMTRLSYPLKERYPDNKWIEALVDSTANLDISEKW